MDATRRVIGRKGVESTSIIDITEEADLGFGTFYNYFDSKEAILAASTAEATEELGKALDRLNEPAPVRPGRDPVGGGATLRTHGGARSDLGVVRCQDDALPGADGRRARATIGP